MFYSTHILRIVNFVEKTLLVKNMPFITLLLWPWINCPCVTKRPSKVLLPSLCPLVLVSGTRKMVAWRILCFIQSNLLDLKTSLTPHCCWFCTACVWFISRSWKAELWNSGAVGMRILPPFRPNASQFTMLPTFPHLSPTPWSVPDDFCGLHMFPGSSNEGSQPVFSTHPPAPD